MPSWEQTPHLGEPLSIGGSGLGREHCLLLCIPDLDPLAQGVKVGSRPCPLLSYSLGKTRGAEFIKVCRAVLWIYSMPSSWHSVQGSRLAGP